MREKGGWGEKDKGAGGSEGKGGGGRERERESYAQIGWTLAARLVGPGMLLGAAGAALARAAAAADRATLGEFLRAAVLAPLRRAAGTALRAEESEADADFRAAERRLAAAAEAAEAAAAGGRAGGGRAEKAEERATGRRLEVRGACLT